MSITIDSREFELISKMNIVRNEFKIVTLDLGDILIESDSRKILIERKTIDDLSSSIIDGRYAEQRARLCDAQQNGYTVLYIIEGKQKSKLRVPHKTILSAIISCCLKYKIPVLPSGDIEDTMYLIEKLAKNIEDYTMKQVNMDYTPSKKVHLEPKMEILCCANRVSPKLSKAILEHYPTIKDIIDKLLTDGPYALCHIDKIGNKISQSIYDILIR
uniref:ERCC4 domain-containing protein n=1 Tax=viral metagenome TaxID=1070528 RepID=A0A6C0FB13_9ZZZZ|tara:strand:- start:4866 stop:5513 length:648 start_codon:yes stop_codon:yes gene_type:complete